MTHSKPKLQGKALEEFNKEIDEALKDAKESIDSSDEVKKKIDILFL